MKIERLTPHLGARIGEVDLAMLGAADADWLRETLDEHLVLFFTGQDLTAEDYLGFGRLVGDLEVTPLLPSLGGDLDAIHIVENAGVHGKGAFADMWHTDVPFRERPPYATILRPEYLPSLGGDTIWASMVAAYEGMADSLRRFADSLEVEQCVTVDGKTHSFIHPAVRVNERTGRQALYINTRFSKRIVGLSELESVDVIRLFTGVAELPDYQVRHRWTPDVVAIWDNGFTQHYAVADYSEPRRMQRMTVKGDPVVGMAGNAPRQSR